MQEKLTSYYPAFSTKFSRNNTLLRSLYKYITGVKDIHNINYLG